MRVFCLHVYTGTTQVSVPYRGDKRTQTPWNWSCELQCGCWGSNPGLLEEQLVLLNLRAFAPDPALHLSL